MKENISDNPPSDSRAGYAAKPFVKSADEFFRKPEGVFWICLLFFGLTVWTFDPALKTDFQFCDESIELLSNSHVNSGLSWQNLNWALFSLDYANWYPLRWISHMLDFELYGADPWGHHLTNVLLHAANGVLLFLVLKRMTGALWRSLIVAALFGLHPLRVESVAWITERKDVLSTFFGLLALWTYACFAEESKTQGGRSKLFYALTLLLFVFSLMSKAMLVTLPCVMLLLDYWPLERWRQKNIWSLVLEKIPFFLLAVPVSMATHFSQKEWGMMVLNFPLGFRLETALMGYARYLGKMFWPTNFSVLYPYPDFWPVGQLLCATAFIFGMLFLCLALRRQQPYLLVGWLWYVGTLVPVIGLIPLGRQSMSNRYTYVPMIGVLLLLVWAVNDLSKNWRRRTLLFTTLVGLVICLCLFRTRAEIVYWKNSETLWRRAIAVTKNNYVAHWILGNILYETDHDKALAEIQQCVNTWPQLPEAQRGLAGLAFLLEYAHHFSDAVVHYEKAIQLAPQNSWAYNGLGRTLFKMNRVSDAIPPLLKAVEMEPQNAQYKDDLGRALSSGDHGTDTVSHFLTTARSDPAGFGRFLEAVQSDTNHVALINNLAWAFATNPHPKLRNGEYAVRLATRTCEMTGFQTTIFVGTLAAAYAEAGRFDEAIATGQKACALAEKNGETNLLKRNQELVRLYQAHQAYHEPPADSNVSPPH